MAKITRMTPMKVMFDSNIWQNVVYPDDYTSDPQYDALCKIHQLIEEGKTGMTFESKNVEDLKEKIQAMWQAEFDHQAIAKQSQERYSAENYYKELMNIYQ